MLKIIIINMYTYSLFFKRDKQELFRYFDIIKVKFSLLLKQFRSSAKNCSKSQITIHSVIVILIIKMLRRQYNPFSNIIWPNIHFPKCQRHLNWHFYAVLRIRIQLDQVFLGHLDPEKYQIRILYPQKDPCNSNILVIQNCLKYSLVKIILLSGYIILSFF